MKSLKLFFFLTPLVGLPAIVLSSCNSYLNTKPPYEYFAEGDKVRITLNQPAIVIKGKVIKANAIGIEIAVINSTLADGNYLFSWSNIKTVEREW